jgi:predicted lipoprotein with Yx(FWY)xxD motif
VGLGLGLAAGSGAGLGLVTATSPAGATATHAKTVTVSTAKVANVGTVLTTASGLTLYRFAEDPAGASVCTGACAKIWPPYFAPKGAHVVGPKGVQGLSLIKVASHWQVAFHKAALFRFENDTKKGQAKGQNVGGVWFAALKSGIPATPAATPTTAPAPTTTNPPTPTTLGSHAGTSGSGTNSSPAPASQMPVTPATTPPISPPTTPPTSPPTTPPTSPPTTPPTSPPTTPTTSAGGGYGY